MNMPDVRWELDSKDARFLDVIQYYGGESTMRQIRERSGLNRSEANYRFQKLKNLGLIHTHKRPYKGQRIKIAVWTDKCEEEIKNGLLNRLDSDILRSQEIGNVQNEIRELREEVSQLENRLNAINNSLEDNRDDIVKFEKQVSEWSERVHSRLSALAQSIKSGTEEDPADYLDE